MTRFSFKWMWQIKYYNYESLFLPKKNNVISYVSIQIKIQNSFH